MRKKVVSTDLHKKPKHWGWWQLYERAVEDQSGWQCDWWGLLTLPAVIVAFRADIIFFLQQRYRFSSQLRSICRPWYESKPLDAHDNLEKETRLTEKVWRNCLSSIIGLYAKPVTTGKQKGRKWVRDQQIERQKERLGMCELFVLR